MLTLEKAQEMVDSATERAETAIVATVEPTVDRPENFSPAEDLHSLSEVAHLLKVSENRIRHWEKSFNQALSNHRNQYNHRMFTDTDVKILERVKFLQDSKLYTREGIIARLNSKIKGKGIGESIGSADKQFQQKLLIALNTLATEVRGLRREVREDLRGDLKKELDHLTLLLFPPQQEKKKWYQIFKK